MALETISDRELHSLIATEQEILLKLDTSPRFDRATALRYHATKQRLNELLNEEKRRNQERDHWRGQDY